MDGTFLLVLVWIGIAFIPAAVAREKGRSFAGFLLLSVFFSPVVGLIAALIVIPDRDALARRASANTLNGDQVGEVEVPKGVAGRQSIGMASDLFELWLGMVREKEPKLRRLSDSALYHEYFLRGYDSENSSDTVNEGMGPIDPA